MRHFAFETEGSDEWCLDDKRHNYSLCLSCKDVLDMRSEVNISIEGLLFLCKTQMQKRVFLERGKKAKQNSKFLYRDRFAKQPIRPTFQRGCIVILSRILCKQSAVWHGACGCPARWCSVEDFSAAMPRSFPLWKSLCHWLSHLSCSKAVLTGTVVNDIQQNHNLYLENFWVQSCLVRFLSVTKQQNVNSQ